MPTKKKTSTRATITANLPGPAAFLPAAEKIKAALLRMYLEFEKDRDQKLKTLLVAAGDEVDPAALALLKAERLRYALAAELVNQRIVPGVKPFDIHARLPAYLSRRCYALKHDKPEMIAVKEKPWTALLEQLE
jgi:hypothetical protein